MNGVGPRTVAKLYKRWPSLKNLFQLKASELEATGLPIPLIQSIVNFNLDSIDADLSWSKADNHSLLTWESPEYPNLLREIPDPPFVLYAKGQLSCLKQPLLAMVGSRNPSITGSENAKYFAHALASRGITIVSGLALGIDAQAHLGCLEAAGQTIAVLGTGVDYIYPRRHVHLAEQIIQNGLLISEFPLKSPPIAGHFPLRNRIISGLSLCTLVVEAALKSGSLITARMALEQNRDVLAIPGSIHNPLARGCHHLLQQGAKLVTSVNDVLDELRIENVPTLNDKSLVSLSQEQEKLVSFIGFETTSVDQIILRSGLPLELVITGLAELELHGIIRSLPGGYLRC